MFIQDENLELKFIDYDEYKKTETSNPVYFVKVGNAIKFEQYVLMANKDLLPKLTILKQGQKVSCTVEASNYNGRTSFMLKDIKAV